MITTSNNPSGVNKGVEPTREETLNAYKFRLRLHLRENKRYGRSADVCDAWESSAICRSKKKVAPQA